MQLSKATNLWFYPCYRRSPFFAATQKAGCQGYDIYNHMLLPGDTPMRRPNTGTLCVTSHSGMYPWKGKSRLPGPMRSDSPTCSRHAI